jgi:hypothetical protein
VMAETQITITVPADLKRVADDYLAALWHVAQFNPAPLGDYQAEKIVGAVTNEIVRRWLAKTEPSMHHHRPGGHHWDELRRFAKYEPGPKGDFDAGQWVPKPFTHLALRNLSPGDTGRDLPTACGAAVPHLEASTDHRMVSCPDCKSAAATASEPDGSVAA